jgi:glucans biosynthesis protein C
VAPQPWAELRDSGGYHDGFLAFYTTDYFDFGRSHGMILPTWNHLWFVAYLWMYTLILALLGLAPASWREGAQRLFDRLLCGWRLFVLPVAWLWLARMTLFPLFDETHELVDDVYAHSLYGFAFFFGVGLARSQTLWETLVANWKIAAAAVVAGYALLAGANLLWPGDTPSPDWATPLFRLGRSVQAWGAILALLGMAQLFLHRDGPARRYLTEAMFPYYITHQTVIVLAGFWLKPYRLGAGVEFAIIAAVTVAGCTLAYEVGRRIRWLRPLLGMKAKPTIPG